PNFWTIRATARARRTGRWPACQLKRDKRPVRRLPWGPQMSPVASYIVQSLVTLLAIVALAVLVLYGGRRLGLGRPSGPLDLVGRLPLDTRRAVYLVRVGKLIYVVGASEGGLTKLGEI